MNSNAAFEWKCHPEAEALLLDALDIACRENTFIEDFSKDVHKHTSTRLFDWVDHIIIGYSANTESEVESAGFIPDHAAASYRVYHHPRAQLPSIVIRDQGQPMVGIAIKADSIADFLMVRGMSGLIEGSAYSGYRRCCVSTDNGVSLWVVERRGVQVIEPAIAPAGYLDRYFESREKWQSRPRCFDDEEEALVYALTTAGEIVEMLGEDAAACLILECERSYWQSRNTAAQIQKNRQNRLGLGWANHDHHTFRSSRRHFMYLVRLFEMLGFHCRERFYAGNEAGWGAQVMENPRSRLVLFLDVDLQEDELGIDFAHRPLRDVESLGTIGLWCALHGDSILKSGMHHLEAQFMFEDLMHDLADVGVGMMEPFSSFPYLKQAFTHGEIWQVEPKRVHQLLEARKISPQQADKFLQYGAVGSHLENLQRREGYKGFNQKNVSFIIKKTDPRHVDTFSQ